MSKTKNLGQVSGVFIGKSAPKNTTIIWYDDTPNQMCHKVYDPVANVWKVLSPDIVSNTTYSELVLNAKKNGLSVGKHYTIIDKSNVLAIAITATKVQYIDSLGNILIDDLGTNIQYHVSSSNLLIDDLSGVFNVESNKLVFKFQEQANVNIETDYLFGKVRNGTKWILSKFRFSSLISKDNGNSISWNNGLFFSFKNAINKILNKSGGIVGYDDYSKKISQIDINIENVSKNNQTIVSNADKVITEKTKDIEIFNKKIYESIEITTAPGDILKGDTLFTIISKIQRWINYFKYATGVKISDKFSDVDSKQFVNNNDTVESAFAKIQYILKNPTTTGVLPDDWSTGARFENGKFDTTGNYTAFKEHGVPVAGDSIFYAFAKIVDFIKQSEDFITIKNWDSTKLGEKPEYGFSIQDLDSLKICLKKIEENTKQIINSQLQDHCVNYNKIVNSGVLPTDVVRFDFKVKESNLFLNGCGIGGIISKDNSGFDLGYVFASAPDYPKDPYRLVANNVWGGGESIWPQVLSFIPVVYFFDAEDNKQLRWTNASSFIHIKEKIYLQFIIYFTDEALAKLKSKGTMMNFKLQVDAYGNKSNQQTYSRSISNNVVIINCTINKTLMEEYYDQSQHIVFSVELDSIS